MKLAYLFSIFSMIISERFMPRDRGVYVLGHLLLSVWLCLNIFLKFTLPLSSFWRFDKSRHFSRENLFIQFLLSVVLYFSEKRPMFVIQLAWFRYEWYWRNAGHLNATGINKSTDTYEWYKFKCMRMQ